jgi:hypothetical protein
MENKDPNYVTPEEAEKMLCPMGMSYNDGEVFCDGPKCMAWRWKELTDWKEGEGLKIEWSAIHGYCGMTK